MLIKANMIRLGNDMFSDKWLSFMKNVKLKQDFSGSP